MGEKQTVRFRDEKGGKIDQAKAVLHRRRWYWEMKKARSKAVTKNILGEGIGENATRKERSLIKRGGDEGGFVPILVPTYVEKKKKKYENLS